MTYDCFIFFNELDLLDLRFNILNPVVDKFVIAEINLTFTGIEKPFYKDEIFKRYPQFKDKIIPIGYKINKDDFKNPWEIEHYQRNLMGQIYNITNRDDTLIMSDVDEIPDPNTVAEYARYGDDIHVLPQLSCQYYLNVINLTHKFWLGSCIMKYKDGFAPQSARDMRGYFPRLSPGGWHFSYLGGREAIKQKLNSFSHHEMNNPLINNNDNIDFCLKNKQDLLGRKELILEEIDIDKYYYKYPDYLLQNKEKFKQFIK